VFFKKSSGSQHDETPLAVGRVGQEEMLVSIHPGLHNRQKTNPHEFG